MRYRALDRDGDYTFGQSQGNFLKDSPECVAQAVLTRLRLWTREWFLNLDDGTPYSDQVLGTGTKALYDVAIRNRILQTPNVTDIVSYSSALGDKRSLSVTARINTAFGVTAVQTNIPMLWN